MDKIIVQTVSTYADSEVYTLNKAQIAYYGIVRDDIYSIVMSTGDKFICRITNGSL